MIPVVDTFKVLYRVYTGVMPDKRLLRKPDERSGPALMDREPILLPEHRKDAAKEMRRRLNLE